MEHAVYERGWAVELAPGASGAEVLAHVVPPYFNRDHLHFSSHAQTPPVSPPGALPAGASPRGARGEGGVPLVPLCRAYRRHGSRVYRTLVRNAIDLLLPQRLVTAGLPSYGQVTVLRQPETRDRLVVHLLAYPVEARTAQLDMIEDVVPLRDVPSPSVRVSGPPGSTRRPRRRPCPSPGKGPGAPDRASGGGARHGRLRALTAGPRWCGPDGPQGGVHCAPVTPDAIGVGIAGYGLAGRVFHAVLVQRTPGLRLRAVCSRTARAGSRRRASIAGSPSTSATRPA